MSIAPQWAADDPMEIDKLNSPNGRYPGSDTTQRAGLLGTLQSTTPFVVAGTGASYASYAVKAGQIDTDGAGLRWELWGRHAGNANTKVIAPDFGTDAIFNRSNGDNGTQWRLVINIRRTAASAGTCSALLIVGTAIVVNAYVALTQSFGSDITFRVGIQGGATGDITCDGGVLLFVPEGN